MRNLHYHLGILPVLYFFFLLLLGRAFFAVTGLRMRGMALWYLSPAMGLAVFGFIIGWLNQAGTPIKSFGQETVVTLSVLSLGVLIWKKCRVPWRKLCVPLLLVLLFTGTVGYPLFLQGANWLSYVNNDFVNYSVGGLRVLQHGFFDVPTREALQNGDPTAPYWFLHVGQGSRPVTDFVLAALSDASRISPREGFMPVILAFGMVQAWALAGAVALRSQSKHLAVPAMAVLLFSPLFVLGVYYQVFAQVGGLGLMLLAFALLVKPTRYRPWRKSLLAVLPCAVAVGSLMWFYPESAPFGLLAAGITLVWGWIVRPAERQQRALWLGMAALVTVVLLHINLGAIAPYLLRQAAHKGPSGLFPYFSEPGAWARLMGWVPFYHTASFWMPWAAFSLLLLLLAVQARKHRTILPLGVVMALIGGYLYLSGGEFGLFKLAMFAQPVLAVGAAVIWRWQWPAAMRLVLLGAWLAATVPTAWVYHKVSLGEPGGPCEAPYASQLGFPSPPKGKGTCQIINMGPGMERIALLHLNRLTANPLPMSLNSLFWAHKDTSETGQRLISHIEAKTEVFQNRYVFWDPPRKVREEKDLSTSYVVEPHFLLSPFNRMGAEQKFKNWFTATKWDKVVNRLALCASAPVGGADPEAAAKMDHFNGLPAETDPSLPGVRSTMMGMGSHLLFEVINPTEEVWVRIAFSRSYLPEGRTQLPPRALVIGAGETGVKFAGNGSANVIVGPLKPMMFNGKALVAFDIGEPLKQISDFDRREIGGWIRDVTALSAEKRAKLKAPQLITCTAQDLTGNPSWEYSGIGEDGIVARECWAVLETKEGARQALRIEGSIPGIPGLEEGNSVTVSLDGVDVRTVEVLPGPFEVLFELPPQAAVKSTKVALSWKKEGKLPRGDRRQASVILKKLGIVTIY